MQPIAEISAEFELTKLWKRSYAELVFGKYVVLSFPKNWLTGCVQFGRTELWAVTILQDFLDEKRRSKRRKDLLWTSKKGCVLQNSRISRDKTFSNTFTVYQQWESTVIHSREVRRRDDEPEQPHQPRELNFSHRFQLQHQPTYWAWASLTFPFPEDAHRASCTRSWLPFSEDMHYKRQICGFTGALYVCTTSTSCFSVPLGWHWWDLWKTWTKTVYNFLGKCAMSCYVRFCSSNLPDKS